MLAENKIEALVTNDKLKTAETPEIVLNENIKAPIKQGDILGTIKYNIDGIAYETNLIAANDVEKSYTAVIIIIILIILVLFYLYSKNNKKKINRRRKRRKNYSNNKYYRY